MKKKSPLVDAAPDLGASGERCSVAAGSAFDAPYGEAIEAPAPGTPGLNPPVKRGDKIRTFCHIEGGGGWWCGPYTVAYLSGDQPAYRPKWSKVEKVAQTWAFAPNTKTCHGPEAKP